MKRRIVPVREVTAIPGQLDIDDAVANPDQTIRDKFLEFHHHHPTVYRRLRRLAREAREADVERVGMRMLWEVLRWNLTLRHGEVYKLNDHYAPHYARLLMEREPELAGMFETRGLRA